MIFQIFGPYASNCGKLQCFEKRYFLYYYIFNNSAIGYLTLYSLATSSIYSRSIRFKLVYFQLYKLYIYPINYECHSQRYHFQHVDNGRPLLQNNSDERSSAYILHLKCVTVPDLSISHYNIS